MLENLEEMKKLATKEDDKTEKKNNEMDKYCQMIHTQF